MIDKNICVKIIFGVLIASLLVLPVLAIDNKVPIIQATSDIVMLSTDTDKSVAKVDTDATLNWTYNNMQMVWSPQADITVSDKGFVDQIKEVIFGKSETVLEAQSINKNVLKTPINDKMSVNYEFYADKIKETIILTEPVDRIYYNYDLTLQDKYENYIYTKPNATELSIMANGQILYNYAGDNGYEMKILEIYKASEHNSDIKLLTANDKYVSFNNNIPAKGGILVSIDDMPSVFYEKPYAIDALGKRFEMNFVLNKADKTVDIEGDLSGATYPINIDPTGNIVTIDTTTIYGKTVIKWIYSSTGGNTTWIVPTGVSSVEYMVLAGGGGGGTWNGGGGGAGGFRNGTVLVNNTINISVGSGGAGAIQGSTDSESGGDSIFGSIIAIGGGSGGSDGAYNAKIGGSGGGGGNTGSGGASGTSGQGYKGGDGLQAASGYPGGGGGGANGAGTNADANTGGTGGAGVYNNLTGITILLAGGGGGGSSATGGTATFGGGSGGNGGAGGHATINTGSGGGGSSGSGVKGGNGSAGMIVIRFTTPDFSTASFTSNATSPYIGNNQVVSFTDLTSGAIGWQWLATNTIGNNTQTTFSNLSNPIQTFQTGNWSITLNATNGTHNSMSTSQWINISPNVLRETVGNYIVETYTDTNGYYNWTYPLNTQGNVDIVLVAGGGSSNGYGGGGAGGMLNQTVTLTKGEGYNIIVGAPGVNTSFGSYITWFGGAGGTIGGTGGNGGSGGGGGTPPSASGYTYRSGGSPSVVGNGFAGGQGVQFNSNTWASSGSGGGAGGAGGDGVPGGMPAGGVGRATTINGTSITYATGGGAGSSAVGAANTGNGATNGLGGSGIVIIRYELSKQDLTANFTQNVTLQTYYPMVVNFNDTTTNGPVLYRNWSMGDGRWVNGTSENITYTYTVAGKYTVGLYVSNATQNSNLTKTQLINLTGDFDSNVISWMHMNGTDGNTTFIGEAGVAWSSAGGAHITTAEYVYGGGSGQFTSNKARITTPSSSILNIGSGNAEIEFWLNVTTPANNRPIIGRTAGDIATGWAFYNSGGGTGYRFEMGGVSTDAVTIPTSTRTHVAITKTGSVIKIYINGILATTKTGYTGTYDLTSPLIIGDPENNGNRFYMDEFRMSVGTPRFTSDFAVPYDQYKGVLETIYPDTNLQSTLRFKTTPPANAYVSNQTPRNRTIQLQNVHNVRTVLGSVGYDADAIDIIGVRLNTTYYASGLTLNSYTINPITQTVEFNVSKDGTGFDAGTDRADFLDIEMAYSRYENPATEEAEYDTFGYGYITNATSGLVYPIHNFIYTNLTFLDWTFACNFTANVQTQTANLPVLFNATYIGDTPDMYNWIWGDGSSTNASTKNQTHIYTSAGTYTVSVDAYMSENATVHSVKTRTNYITIYEIPVVNFTGTPLYGATPLTVIFTDTSTHSPTNWEWNFGDGTGNVTITNGTIVSHTYTSAGVYNVSLIASNLGGSGYMVRNNYISVSTAPVANFIGSPTSGYTPFDVQFTDTSSNSPTSWTWNFGDGTPTNSTQNPLHTYTTDGTFTVSLTASNMGGSDGETKNAYITSVTAPVANFIGSPTSGINPLTVVFTDTSTHYPTAWAWDFGDGNTSNVANPTHIFATGIYTISLTVSNAAGNDAEVKTNYITSQLIPITDFSATPLSGITPLTVVFTDHTVNVVNSWLWDFGDGNTSTTQSPTHIYVSGGVYNVSLTSTNIYGSDTETKTSYITAINPSNSIITNPVIVTTVGGQYCAQFDGYNYGSPTTGWFEYGSAAASSLNPTGTKSFKTKNQTIGYGNFSAQVCGIPLLPEKSYVVSSVAAVGSQIISGSNQTFTMGVLTPHATTTYTEFSDKFTEDGGNPIELLTTDPWLVYTGLWGSGLFFGLLIFFIYANVVIKQRGVIITILLMIITGGAVFAFLPDEFMMVAQILIISGFAGIVYWIFFRRQ